MHADVLLHRWLGDVLPEMHKMRRKALGSVICGALRGGRLTVTSLGRWLDGKAKTKHSIKRADRLISNKHLQSEGSRLYSAIVRQVLGETKEPVILVDWSDIDARRKFFLLRATTPVKGRSITLYEEVHELRTREKPRTHRAFLLRLSRILPKGCTPIIITDAGFRTPWYRAVEALGWNFVGRVRNREKVKIAKNAWIPAKALHAQATSTPQHLGCALLTASNEFHCHMVLFKAIPKGRARLGKMGKRKRNRTSLVNAARGREPWLLATSLRQEARSIVRLYSRRMQIEESFRDLKCPRHGLSLYLNGTYKLERMKILVMIGSLATIYAWLLGKAAQATRLHQQFQANTVRHLHVLSAVFVGIQILRKKRAHISAQHFRYALTTLPELAAQ